MISEFLANMAADGRLTIPKLTLQILTEKEEKDLTGSILEVTISPAGEPGGAASTVDSEPAESPEAKLLGKINDIRKNLNKTTPN